VHANKYVRCKYEQFASCAYLKSIYYVVGANLETAAVGGSGLKRGEQNITVDDFGYVKKIFIAKHKGWELESLRKVL